MNTFWTLKFDLWALSQLTIETCVTDASNNGKWNVIYTTNIRNLCIMLDMLNKVRRCNLCTYALYIFSFRVTFNLINSFNTHIPHTTLLLHVLNTCSQIQSELESSKIWQQINKLIATSYYYIMNYRNHDEIDSFFHTL